jgi:hypothetical protein
MTKAATTNSAPPSPAPPTAQPPSSLPLDIARKRIIVKHGSVTVENPASGRPLTLTDVEVDAAITLSNGEFHIPEASLSLLLDPKIPITATLKQLTINQVTKAVTLATADIATPAGTVHVDSVRVGARQVAGTDQANASTTTASLSTDALDLGSARTLLAGVVPNLEKLNLSGTVATQLALSLSNKAPLALKGPVTLQKISVKLPNGSTIQNGAAQINLDGSTNDLGVSLRNATLNFNGSALTLG